MKPLDDGTRISKSKHISASERKLLFGNKELNDYSSQSAFHNIQLLEVISKVYLGQNVVDDCAKFFIDLSDIHYRIEYRGAIHALVLDEKGKLSEENAFAITEQTFVSKALKQAKKLVFDSYDQGRLQNHLDTSQPLRLDTQSWKSIIRRRTSPERSLSELAEQISLILWMETDTCLSATNNDWVVKSESFSLWRIELGDLASVIAVSKFLGRLIFQAEPLHIENAACVLFNKRQNISVTFAFEWIV